ncbi:MAG: aldo/keto reductase [Cyanobacteria bacterium P01_F01_bin.33]
MAERSPRSRGRSAVAWVLSRGYSYFPIVGARKVSQIEDVIGAAELQLSEVQLQQLDQITAIELGFPHDFLASEHVLDMGKGEIRSKINFRPKQY